MTAFQTLAIVSVAVAAISIAILMLEDVFAELERRRREHEIFATARREARHRHS
jgi:hypothetical protein